MSDSDPLTFTIAIPPPFVSGKPIEDNVAFAYSCTQNRRNFEAPWYGPLNQTGSKVVDFPMPIGTLSVLPQHPISISSAKLYPPVNRPDEIRAAFPDGYSDDDTDAPEGDRLRRSTRVKQLQPRAGPSTGNPASTGGRKNRSDAQRDAAIRKQLKKYYEYTRENPSPTPSPPSSPLPPQVPSQGHEQSHGPEEPGFPNDEPIDVGDISFQVSSHASASDRRADDNYPDLLFNHSITLTMRKPASGRRGLKVVHQCSPAILEAKRGPSRCMRGQALDRAIERLLQQAERDLLTYISAYFMADEHASAVIGISTAGGYWRWAVVKRADVPEYELLLREFALRGQEMLDLKKFQKHFHALFNGHPWQYLGEPESDAEWTKLRDEALIPLLEAHATDYPEFMQWLQPETVKGKGKMKQFPVGKSGKGRKSGTPPVALRRSTRVRRQVVHK
ncbi:hypothetical protein L227DRAFT_235180 [Lentinus tigrinus ALCF2SS1-6]|uniref:Uncharacterized protein n=1 Tax=Lentinus tigrinus ALCF2SS1-6 TaxID=1328759 RepID=A0A5C2S7F5_9APHY|nr:hypothetical protein L227DRAFT_235180 [Lentinus tigrinus ALCF2SS1-6]